MQSNVTDLLQILEVSRTPAIISRGFLLFPMLRAPARLHLQSNTRENPLQGLNAQRAESLVGGTDPVDLARIQLPMQPDHAQAIAALSAQSSVPMKDAIEVYKAEFARLEAGARVPTYLIVLALNRTRAILRARSARATVN